MQRTIITITGSIIALTLLVLLVHPATLVPNAPVAERALHLVLHSLVLFVSAPLPLLASLATAHVLAQTENSATEPGDRLALICARLC